MTLADNASPGGLGFLIVVVFFIAAVVIFVAMSRSLRRMRAHVDRGDFGDSRTDGSNREGRTPPSA